jgi:hypothetical protein
MQVDAEGVRVATEGAATANGADLSVEGSPMADDGTPNEDLPLRSPVAADAAAGEDLPLGTPLVAAAEATGLDLAPKVAASLILVFIFFRPSLIYTALCVSWIAYDKCFCSGIMTSYIRFRLAVTMTCYLGVGYDKLLHRLLALVILNCSLRGGITWQWCSWKWGFIFIKLMFLETRDCIFLLICRCFIEIW